MCVSDLRKPVCVDQLCVDVSISKPVLMYAPNTMLAAVEPTAVATPFSRLVQPPGSVAWLGGTWLGDKTVATVLEPGQQAGLTVSRPRNKYAQAPGAGRGYFSLPSCFVLYLP